MKLHPSSKARAAARRSEPLLPQGAGGVDEPEMHRAHAGVGEPVLDAPPLHGGARSQASAGRILVAQVRVERGPAARVVESCAHAGERRAAWTR